MTILKLDIGLLFIFFGIHLTLPLTVNGTMYVPEILISSFLFVSAYIFRVVLSKKQLRLLFSIVFLAILTILLSPDWMAHYIAHIRSLANLIFSLVVALSLITYLKCKSLNADIQFNLTVFISIALVISTMEVFLPLVSEVINNF